MPASLRLLAVLVAACVVAAIASGGGMYWETRERTRTMAEATTGGHVDAGQAAIIRYGCGSCHRIPGIHQAAGTVGPDLSGIAARAEIAGLLPNGPAPMVRWLEHPQAVAPGNGMPEQGVTDRDARDMSAYLAVLK